MGDRACEKLEKACEEAWEKWQKSLRGGVGAAPATEELGSETPPPSDSRSAVDVGLRRQYDDCARRLRKCYEENEVPPDEERWPKR